MSDNADTDNALVRDCLAGTPGAWEALVGLALPAAAAAAGRVLAAAGRRDEVDDVCQDVFARLLANDRALLRRFDSARSSLAFYIALIARSQALNRLRTVDRLRPWPEGVGEPVAPTEPAGSPAEDEDWRLAAGLATLGARERQIIELIFRQGLEAGEVAERLGLSAATVRSGKRFALRKLRAFFIDFPGHELSI